MQATILEEKDTTLRFSAKLHSAETAEKTRALIYLPGNVSGKLQSRVGMMVEGTINGFPFRAALETVDGSYWFKVTKAMRQAAGADTGETATVEITRVDKEPETRAPMELRDALAAAPRAERLWKEITPIARRDWILWITSAKQPETRQSRIEKACDMLASGKRRVCCFGGLNWLTKDHRSVDTWLPLPKPKTSFTPESRK